MRVLLINSVCGIGSTGRICTDLASELEKQGNEALIAYGRDGFVPEQFQKYAVRICSDSDIKINGIASRLFDNHGFGTTLHTKRFVRWIQEFDPDIIHLHNVHGYYLNVEILFEFLKTWNKPIIWTLHDCWPFTGHCVYFDYIGCDKWKKQCTHCPQIKMYPASWIVDNSKNNYERKRKIFCGLKNLTIVTPSDWLKNLINQSFLHGYETEVINNGIDTQIFKPTKSNIREKYAIKHKVIVLGVSMGWTPSKHLDYMIRLANDLGEQHQVVLIGLSEDQKNNLPKNIMGIPKTRNIRELVEWYSAADVFVNPTMEDNYPTVNLEAQACGTPVITFRSGGSAECIKDGYGIAVERGNYSELLKAIDTGYKFKHNMKLPRITDKNEFANQYLALYQKQYKAYAKNVE